MILFFRVLSVIMLILTAILMICHFVLEFSAFWFSIPLAVSIVTNLVASILYIKVKNKK